MKKPLKTRQGDELTDEVLEQLADEAERGYAREDWTGETIPNPLKGRPPLSRSGASHHLRIRIEPELDQALRALAEAEDRSLSELTRAALREYIERHAA